MEVKRFENYYNLNKEFVGKEIYILGCNNRAGALYSICLNKNIYVSGFISDEIEGKFLGKKVVRHENLPKNSVVVSKISELLRFYSDNEEEHIIIYGAGNVGSSLIRNLHFDDRKKVALVDTYKMGQKICDVEVYSSSYIKEHMDDSNIIIAMYDYLQVYESLRKMGVNSEKIYILKYDVCCYEDFVYFGNLRESDFATMYEINYLSNISNSKTFLLYGEYFKQTIELLNNLDINISNIVALREDILPEDISYIWVEDLIYEEDYIVITGKNGDCLKHEMKQMDLDINCIECIHSVPMDCRFLNTAALEVNLGQSYKSENSYPGITRYGKGENKIFITGGSMTDGTLYRFKSWPEIFYQKINNNKNISIFNGGVWGYFSAQELYRVIQDAIPLRCELVVSYTGINDILGRKRTPYANAYETIINEFAAKHMNSYDYADISGITGVEVFEGVPYSVEEDFFDIWLNNILYMNAICKTKGIRYYAFLQPSPFTQENISLKEQYVTKACAINKYEANYSWSKVFRERIKKVVEEYDFIFDLSDIFDGVCNIYIDNCHVYEKGNEIIANHILNHLREIGENL